MQTKCLVKAFISKEQPCKGQFLRIETEVSVNLKTCFGYTGFSHSCLGCLSYWTTYTWSATTNLFLENPRFSKIVTELSDNVFTFFRRLRFYGSISNFSQTFLDISLRVSSSIVRSLTVFRSHQIITVIDFSYFSRVGVYFEAGREFKLLWHSACWIMPCDGWINRNSVLITVSRLKTCCIFRKCF